VTYIDSFSCPPEIINKTDFTANAWENYRRVKFILGEIAAFQEKSSIVRENLRVKAFDLCQISVKIAPDTIEFLQRPLDLKLH